MTEPKEVAEIHKRAYLLASVACDQIWGGEHGWETASNEEFTTLLANLKEKLAATCIQSLATENAALREKLAERDALLLHCQSLFGDIVMGEGVDGAEAADRIAALEAELIEQARLNGKGAEREAKLQAKLAVAREALEQARHEMRRGIDNIMGIETEAMHGDNLAVSLCSYFERHEEEVGEGGWAPSAIAAYEEVRSAIKGRFDSSERIFGHALTQIDTLTGGDNAEG